MKTARIRNWAEFQHYKDRSPPWIKLQKSLLDNYEFACLPIASKALAPLLWLLASESTDGTVRIDTDWLAFRLRWSVDDVMDGVQPLLDNGFLEADSAPLASRYRDACLEGEAETEAEIPVANATGSGSDGTLPAADGDADESKGKRRPCPFVEIVSAYHECLPAHPHVEKLTDARKGLIRQRWLQDLPTIEAWRNYFADVSQSKFLTGRTEPRQGKPPFIADLEWLCRPSSFAKVAEGKYHR